ncbi:hypothetical protein CCMSSC00406_0005985 [Pleurotus cornucopiae]|uniref:Uncharacterized protein n=1 Tax=Pleurotus cornucopiae TaxID=5321 RepID=A0ACB7IQ00_PLECO|nr:hypothetical protein CCMSSC00406_0005985 [Pleurotus cornucopiae]
MSPSPTYRERQQRSVKTQSMPLVPTLMQIYQNQQSSPTISNPTANRTRSPPPQGTLPPNTRQPQSASNVNANSSAAAVRGSTPDRGITPPPASYVGNAPNPGVLPHTQSTPNVNASQATHFPRPNRAQAAQFLSSFQEMEHNWQMTDELLAEIEQADKQQTRSQAQIPQVSSSAQTSLSPRDQTNVVAPESQQLRDANVERVKSGERSSPKDSPDVGNQQRRQTMPARESPNFRDRQPNSPTAPAFPPQERTPELRGPSYHVGANGGDMQSPAYNQYPRDSPPVARRPNPDVRSQPQQPSATSQTPPVALTRSPDRSLPFQEEAEDDVHLNGHHSKVPDDDAWDEEEETDQDIRHDIVSPAPSSDIHPTGPRYDVSRMHVGGRESRTGHRGDEVVETRATPSDEDAFTPRSPTAELPEDPSRFVVHDHSKTIRGPRHRNGSADQLGYRVLDASAFVQPSSGKAPEPTSATSDQRLAATQQSLTERAQYVQPNNINIRPSDLQNGQYYSSQILSDDAQSLWEHPSAEYIQAYVQSPRPGAPVPPTPHSQTAAPSPSPFVSGMYSDAAKDMAFSPIPPIGSPYPYPFSHVRRANTYAGQLRNPPPPSSTGYDPNHPSVIQEQLVKQWQIYAQNNQGHISDSTLSPSSTPYPGGAFIPWAYLHTKKMLGIDGHDPRSIQSSPSHEPLPLPPNPAVGLKKKEATSNLRVKPEPVRKPPPRVESTQPRDTSPEPSTSGEETAGEERYTIPREGTWLSQNTRPPTAGAVDDDADWIDEDDDPDDDDLLELEYHPSFINNVEKRRRRWDARWEALVQSFQALDRQTDATLVLLAAPSHSSSKMYSITSRSIRRQPAWRNSPAMANLRSNFRHIAVQRRATRVQRPTLADRLLAMPTTSSSGGDGSDGSNESREEDLKRALGTALGSLGALGTIYEQREARWKDEMRRIGEDRERVELLLKQALGEDALNSLRSPHGL